MENPLNTLRGENLEYYKNIEYLKEMTRQAQALLDRSNAKYENILDNFDMGVKVRARSLSDSAKSDSPDYEGKCVKCGLTHGTTNYCILEQILDDEKGIDRRKSVRTASFLKDCLSTDVSAEWLEAKASTKSSVPTATFGESKSRSDWKVNLLGKMTSSELLTTYENISNRYGESSSRRFLLVNSLAQTPEQKIDKWVTQPEECKQKIQDLLKGRAIPDERLVNKCPPPPSPVISSPSYPEVSEKIKQKMKTLDISYSPKTVQTFNRGWKAALKNLQAKNENDVVVENEPTPLLVTTKSPKFYCACANETCLCGHKSICGTPKQVKPHCRRIDNDEENNYLLTIRNRMYLRREKKRATTQYYSKQQLDVAAKRAKSKISQIQDWANNRHYQLLKDCLSSNVNKELDDEEFEKNFRILAHCTSPFVSLDTRQWDFWSQNMEKLKKLEQRDEVDSFGSTIGSEAETPSESSPDTIVEPKRMKHTRIPYADDVYDLIDNLFDKISRKFEKSIVKNSNEIALLAFRPTFASLHTRLSSKISTNPVYGEIVKRTKHPIYRKRWKPYKIVQMKKLSHLEKLMKVNAKKMRRRNRVWGLQKGKQYVEVRKSTAFTKEKGYAGFTPPERELLDVNTPNRFGLYSLNMKEKPITTHGIHRDFRLMRRMFEDAVCKSREDLIDEGMKQRWLDFQRMIYKEYLPPSFTDIRDEHEASPKIPVKEEVQLLRKANVASDPKVLKKRRSNENVPAHQLKRNPSSSATADMRKIESQPQESANVSGRKKPCSRKLESWQSSALDFEAKAGIGKSVSGWGESESQLDESVNTPHVPSNCTNEPGIDLKRVTSSKQLRLEPEESGKHEIKSEASRLTKSQSLTKLPKLTTNARKSNRNANSFERNESAPYLRPRESLENLKPVGTTAKLPKIKNKSQSGFPKSISANSEPFVVLGKLPSLAQESKLSPNSSLESIANQRKTKVLKQMPGIRQQFRPWR